MLMIYKRLEKKLLWKRLQSEPRRFIQVIFGPRQVGKTTLVKQIIEDIEYPSHYVAADAIPAGDQVWIAQQWERARILLRSEKGKPLLLVIDEAQKIDNWSEQVKAEWDKDTLTGMDIRVAILGSSRLMLQRGLTESL